MELCHETDWPHCVIRGVSLILEFLRTPVSQTSASNWLTRFILKEIFSSSRRRSIVETFPAVFEKFDFKHRHVMSADRRISPYTTVYFYRSFYECQPHQLARPIGWLGWGERKYSPLSRDEVLLKNFEPFLRNIDSYGVMSWNRLATFRY